uniref:Lipid-binding serum glycoprotein N-terminal domain-containing protein n=1 Tax=Prolemur simus TaxID=1328070 RepID=A0A8C9DG48_PROSS
MLQLWKLVLLCSLLTGTSEALLENLGNDVHDAVDKLKPVVDKGLETVDNTLKGILQKLKVDLKGLQESKEWQLAKKKVQEAETLVDNALSNVHLSTEKTGPHMFGEVSFRSKTEGQALFLPHRAQVENRLFVGQVVSLMASLDLLSGVKVETDAQTQLPTVVLGECTSDPTSISLSLLDRVVTSSWRINPFIVMLRPSIMRMVRKLYLPSWLQLGGRGTKLEPWAPVSDCPQLSSTHWKIPKMRS